MMDSDEACKRPGQVECCKRRNEPDRLTPTQTASVGSLLELPAWLVD